MKIRTPDCECIICQDNGEPIIKAVDRRGTYFAIKRMRQFIDAKIAEDKERETNAQPKA
ncbi:MAG: hypothetical protein WC869_01380 [Phycisphaerae bacterium]|jgi:hypothetical protein